MMKRRATLAAVGFVSTTLAVVTQQQPAGHPLRAAGDNPL